MAKTLRQLTASYERSVRTMRQNADKIESGEWDDDDVFAEAFRQAAAYKGRAIETSAPSAPAAGSPELLATYLIAKGVPLLDLDTIHRSFIVEDVDEGQPDAIRAMIDDNPAALPQREYDVYAQRRNGQVTHLIIDLGWKAFKKEDYTITQAREYLDRLPGLLEFTDRLATYDPDKYGQSGAHFQADADYLRQKFAL